MRGQEGRAHGLGQGIGDVTAIQEDGLVGKVYFEVHPDRLANDNIFVELYGEIEMGLGDCSETGVLLSKKGLANKHIDENVFDHYSNNNDLLQQQSAGTNGQQSPSGSSQIHAKPGENFSWRVVPFPKYNEIHRNQAFECHPRSPDAVMAAAEFAIPDPFGISNEGTVWFPVWEQDSKQFKKKGVLQYCVRVIVESSDPRPNQYIDTKFKLEGDRRQENFGDNVRIYSNQPIDSKHAYIKNQNVEVDAFLCEDPSLSSESESESSDTVEPKLYNVGDPLSICVGPKAEFAESYQVTSFDNLICENKGQSRALIVDGVQDILTKVGRNNAGYRDVRTGTVVHTAGILVAHTTITTGLIQLKDKTAVCTGEAHVESKNQRDVRRSLKKLERETMGEIVKPFKVTVNLAEFVPGSESSSVRNYPCRWSVLGSLLVPPLMAAVVGLV